jgi:hypothetical protein
MQHVGLAIVVALVVGLSLGVSTSASAQSRNPSNPYDRLFREQINPDLKPALPPSQPAQLPKHTETRTLALEPVFQNIPVCMPTMYGDASLDPTFGHAPVTNGPTPLIRVVPAPPCRKTVR